jgi:type II secretory pathway pseudopilin PulG
MRRRKVARQVGAPRSSGREHRFQEPAAGSDQHLAGFGLVEILVSVAIVSALVSVSAFSMAGSLAEVARSQESSRAAALATEAAEGVRAQWFDLSGPSNPSYTSVGRQRWAMGCVAPTFALPAGVSAALQNFEAPDDPTGALVPVGASRGLEVCAAQAPADTASVQQVTFSVDTGRPGGQLEVIREYYVPAR